MDIAAYRTWFRSLEKCDLVAIEVEENKKYLIRKIDDIYNSPSTDTFEIYLEGARASGEKYTEEGIEDSRHPWLHWKIVPITENVISHTEAFDLYSRLRKIDFSKSTLAQLQAVYYTLLKEHIDLKYAGYN
jgi:hypothetical protein